MGSGHQAPDGPPQPVAQWAADRLQTAVHWVAAGHDHGESEVWRGSTEAGVRWLKRWRQPDKWRRERIALTEWAPALPAVGVRVPSVLHHDEGLRVQLLTHVPGTPGEQDDRAQTPATYRQVGRALAALHAQDPGAPDPMPVATAHRKRARAWARRARGLLPESTIQAVVDAASDPAAFEGLQRVPCHRDCTERNWLIDADGTLGLIDFEHARCDPWLSDLLRLEEWVFPDRPDLRAAFFEGYGRTPDPTERRALSAMRGLHALSTVAWSVEHRDRAFEEQGRGALARWLAERDGNPQEAG